MNDYKNNLHDNSRASMYENARMLRRTETKAEKIMWQALRNEKVCKMKFRRQHAFDNYVLDFYCHKMKLAIELDGAVHDSEEARRNDEVRTKNLNENGITVLRFTNNEVETNFIKVIAAIEYWFDENDFEELPLPPDKD